jgi:hypothetical protein
MRWQRVAALAPEALRVATHDSAHGNVTEDKCQIILSLRAAVAMNAEDEFLTHCFVTPASIRTHCQAAFAHSRDYPIVDH